jgi:hypothetical protein
MDLRLTDVEIAPVQPSVELGVNEIRAIVECPVEGLPHF